MKTSSEFLQGKCRVPCIRVNHNYKLKQGFTIEAHCRHKDTDCCPHPRNKTVRNHRVKITEQSQV